MTWIPRLMRALPVALVALATACSTTSAPSATSTGTPSSAEAAPSSGVSFQDSGQRLGTVSSWDVQLVDVDADGVLEAYFDGSLWANDGAGQFARSDLSFGPAESQAWFADLDGDGHVDAVCDNVVYLNDGEGGFAEGRSIPSGIPMLYAEPADLDGDGAVDLVVASATEDRVLLNDGTGGFSATGTTLGGWSQCRYAVGDLNGDGVPDVYVVVPHTPPPEMDSVPNTVWLGDGRGGFVATEHDAMAGQSRDVVVADFDQDDDLDVFVASGTSASRLFLNDGSGGLVPSDQAFTTGLHATDAQAADLDGDGDLDLFLANGMPFDDGQPNTVWLNDGNGSFLDSGLRLGALNSVKVALGDVDGDDRIDAVVANVDLETNDAPVEVWLRSP